jgi:single-stranded DNA-binding protein
MSSIIIKGRVGFVEARRFPSGKSLFKFSVAEYEYKKTTWFTCEAWNELGDRAITELDKGKSVTVTGRLELQTYTDKSGKQVMKAVIIASDFAVEQPQTASEPATEPVTPTQKTREKVA